MKVNFPKSHRTFSLRTTLVVAVIASSLVLMGMMIGWVGIPGYNKVKLEVRELWKHIAEEVAINATETTLNYFQTAPITLKILTGLVEEGQIKTNQKEEIFDLCYWILKENSEFMLLYYALPDGSCYTVLKYPDRYEANYTSIQPDGKTLLEVYKIGLNHTWVKTEEMPDDYDPRTRPFWKVGVIHPEGGWTDPYLFATTKDLGYTYVLAQTVEGEVQGYWGVDFKIDRLADFLHTLKVGQEGGIYLLTDKGAVIAESVDTGETLKQIKDRHRASGYKTGYFRIGSQIFYANKFPSTSPIPWTLITSIHENDFLQPIRHDAIHALAYGLIPCLLFLVLIALLFGKISRRLKEIAWEMDGVGNLNFNIPSPEYPHSRIREINAMNHALLKMKVGLQSFARYLSIDLIKKLLFSGKAAESGAEKKETTVLFADLEHFTSTAENIEPSEAVKVIEEFLTTASQEIHKEKGIIDKFMGDSVMALWGVPDPIPDPALAACRTALTLKKRFEMDPKMKHKIGINTGPAMVGNFGSNERLDYTAIGDTVNVAARLEKLNKHYGTQILVGPQTAAAVEATLLLRPLQWVMLEGRSTPLLAYELLGEKKGAPESLLQAIKIYTLAIEAHRHKRYSEAVQLFDQANALFGGNDTPSKLLKEESLKLSR